MEIRHNEFWGIFLLDMDVPLMYSMSPQGYSASWSQTINPPPLPVSWRLTPQLSGRIIGLSGFTLPELAAQAETKKKLWSKLLSSIKKNKPPNQTVKFFNCTQSKR